MDNKQIRIPPDLENMLVEFTINVIVENPDDLVSHAADYFARLKEEKHSAEAAAPDGSKAQIEKILGKKAMRRPTVMGEQYNPEEDDLDDDDVEIFPKTDEERDRIKEKSKDVFLFRVLDESDFVAIIDAMNKKTVKPGDIVIRQGDDGDFFYLIDEGSFNVFITDPYGEETKVHTYEGCGTFGELALLHNQPRAATVIAATEGSLWAMSRRTFTKLVVKRAFQKRQKYMQLLENVPQLKALTEYEKMQIADALVPQSFTNGEVVCKQDDEGDGMYFIEEGIVGVMKKQKDGSDKEMCELGPGAYFGEMAIVKKQPRAASVIAKGDVKLAFLEVQAFERLLGSCLEIMKRHIDTYKD